MTYGNYTTTEQLRAIAADNGIEIVNFPIHRKAAAVKVGEARFIVLNTEQRTEEETRQLIAEMLEAHLAGAYTGTISGKARA